MPVRQDKAAVFIDGAYLSAILKNYFQETRVDFLRLSEELCGDCERFRTYYYNCPPHQSGTPTPEEQRRKAEFDRFLYNLRRLPRLEVRLGTLRRTGNPQQPYEQKGVDVLLSIDLVELSATGTIDQAILLTGDSDFVLTTSAVSINHISRGLILKEGTAGLNISC